MANTTACTMMETTLVLELVNSNGLSSPGICSNRPGDKITNRTTAITRAATSTIVVVVIGVPNQVEIKSIPRNKNATQKYSQKHKMSSQHNKCSQQHKMGSELYIYYYGYAEQELSSSLGCCGKHNCDTGMGTSDLRSHKCRLRMESTWSLCKDVEFHQRFGAFFSRGCRPTRRSHDWASMKQRWRAAITTQSIR